MQNSLKDVSCQQEAKPALGGAGIRVPSLGRATHLSSETEVSQLAEELRTRGTCNYTSEQPGKVVFQQEYVISLPKTGQNAF